jgi:tRNA-dihydrouridine synthase A
MQTIGAIEHNAERALKFDIAEHPIAIQLGGSDPIGLAQSAVLAQHCGFDEINLNLGCPSDRVQSGRFGACLMNDPSVVSDCIAAMKEVVHIPVTAKVRIGIDENDSYDFFSNFSQLLINVKIDKLIVHARKAWLNGLSPKQNRTIPPVQYEYVYQFKKENPYIPLVINGNIGSLEEVKNHLDIVDGVMLGRLACNDPYAIATIHHGLYPDVPLPSRVQLLQQYQSYFHEQSSLGVPLSLLFKAILNLAHGLPNAKCWKNVLVEYLKNKQAVQMTHLIEIMHQLESYNHGILEQSLVN